MPLDKQNVSINFGQGLDTKSDEKQVQMGKFLSLENSVFQKAGLLQKRNGFQKLTDLPTVSVSSVSPSGNGLDYNYLTTFNDNLTAIGPNIAAYSANTASWVSKGQITSVDIDTLPLIRNAVNQSQCDAVVASNGLVCTTYTETVAGVDTYKYAVADSVTGQNIVAPTLIPATAGGTVTGSPKVFLLGQLFVVVFTNVVGGTLRLQYLSLSQASPTNAPVAGVITTSYTNDLGIAVSSFGWGARSTNTQLFVAYTTAAGGNALKVTYLTAAAAAVGNGPVTPQSYGGVAPMAFLDVCIDSTLASSPTVYVNFCLVGNGSIPVPFYTCALDQNLNSIFGPVSSFTSPSSSIVTNITATAVSGVCSVYVGVDNVAAVAYTPDYITKFKVTRAGVFTNNVTCIRSVQLASRAFIYNGSSYFLCSTGTEESHTSLQPTYFLVNGSNSTSSSPVVVAKLAYQNGGGYVTENNLPETTVSGNKVYIPYLFKDLIQSANKGTANPAGTQTAQIYTQTGINLATFSLGTQDTNSSEIGKNLHLSGGFLWTYDGYLPVEHGFFLYPEYVNATWSATGGAIVAKPDGATNTNAYYYQVTYEWADNQGNIHRSAPSVPVAVTTTGAGSVGSISLKISTLCLTYKISNPVKIVIYRWSVAQQSYYQVTSLTSPTLNNTTVDFITYVDTLGDSSILGNSLIYTTGGVVENIAAPACTSLALFKSRLVLIDAEDRNLLWYSKQVIESTPAELSDLFTIYTAPSIGANGSTGVNTALAAMDDKLIVFKKDAAYYITGNGPDNTGANNDFSDPVYITSTVGCDNQKSIVFIPSGLVFESDKGIWLLGRDLSTQYIGAPVERFTQDATVLSAISVPGTNQVRFTMSSGITLMYDYYFQQWGTFANIPATCSTLFQGLHTYINTSGQVFQEKVGSYLDGSNPVLMSFQTSWFNLMGLQGFERAYEFYFLGEYVTPHKLNVGIAYDYAPYPEQITLISPDNYNPNWGGDALWGSGSPWGGVPSLEQWRIFFDRQKCQAFQISMTEVYDPSFGVPAGAGFTLSGLDMTVGMKAKRPKLSASRQTG